MIRYIRPGRNRDSTIPLINVVFLILIFFLITGTIAPPLDPDLDLVNTADLDGREPPDALVLHRDGTLSFRGNPIEAGAFMAAHDSGAVRIVPDRNASASRLMEITSNLRRLGAPTVFLVTEQALE
ncbi:biopolymer transporter ExbD [Ruegeria sp. HKCCD6157]|uniref:ExbD/TolR family protein n=1 Tax=Ruegeria sp. HKCCD6157 TaxID=2690707 RepID=UPI001490C5BA|nr:biopolymer transporter ExbD [Ruegeria sp. HKCCD6157]NOE27155.1 biopolymer transporter ExbD [Ruegeria sp. HKCCD6157]